MHPMFFSVKQTHIALQRRLAPLAAEFELTPARFDLMRVVSLFNEWGIPQWKLVRMLGVAAAVVSRMLKQLTKLGFIRRYRDPNDRRVNIVHLTEPAEERVHSLIETHVWDGGLECIAYETFSLRGGEYELGSLYERLTLARVRLKARAPFLHPWRIAPLFDANLQFLTLARDDRDTRIPRREIDAVERTLARIRKLTDDVCSDGDEQTDATSVDDPDDLENDDLCGDYMPRDDHSAGDHRSSPVIGPS